MNWDSRFTQSLPCVLPLQIWIVSSNILATTAKSAGFSKQDGPSGECLVTICGREEIQGAIVAARKVGIEQQCGVTFVSDALVQVPKRLRPTVASTARSFLA